ncbi:MAG: flagellar biosynthetic protein FliO [Polyangia bacterium]
MATAMLWSVLGLALCALGLLWVRRTPSERVRYRLELEPRRSIYVVELGGRNLVLASSEAGIQLLMELDDRAVARLPVASAPALPALLQSAWKRS